jgi:HSP20 family molecular chaperone IbpA
LEIASYFAVPLNHLIAIADEHNRLLQQQLEQFLPALPAPKGPAVNVAESETEVEVELMLPGFKKDDIELEIGRDFLTVSGHMDQEKEGQLVRQEFVTHSFSRTIQLPAEVDDDSAVATMKHGILTVRLKKQSPQVKTRRIEIVDR